MPLVALSSKPLKIILSKIFRHIYSPWTLVYVGIKFLWGYMRRFFRKDTSNYCWCYSRRLDGVRCRPFLPKNRTRNV